MLLWAAPELPLHGSAATQLPSWGPPGATAQLTHRSSTKPTSRLVQSSFTPSAWGCTRASQGRAQPQGRTADLSS